MATKTNTASMTFIRSLAIGALLSLSATYLLHVFGEWKLENFRPDPETTSSLILYNKCAVFGDTHILRPGSDVSTMSNSIDGTKLAGSFMNFFDGHIVAMIVLSFVLGTIVFLIRKSLRR